MMTEQKRMVSIEAGLLDSLIDFYDIMVALDYQSEALDYLFDIDNETGEQNIPDWARLRVASDYIREQRDELNTLQATGNTQCSLTLEAENERLRKGNAMLRDFVEALAQGIDVYERWALAQGVPLTDENVIREYQYIIAGAQATLQASDSAEVQS